MNRRQLLTSLAGWAAAMPALAQAPTRPFRMGFTPFSVSSDAASWQRAFDVIRDHGDLVALFLQDGIPWDEAEAGLPVTEFPEGIRGFYEFQLQMINGAAPNHARYVAINPVSPDYRQLAANWSRVTNEPLLYPWNTYDFDHPRVKNAFLNYTRAVVNFFQPTYLNIGIETNILLARNYEHWPAYLELHRHLYTSLKQEFPSLPVMVSVQYEHLLGLHSDSSSLEERLADSYPGVLKAETAKLLQFSDILALSTYPYMVQHNAITEDYFTAGADLAASKGIGLAIDQTGYSSVPLEILGTHLPGSEEAQMQYVNFILWDAQRRGMQFVVNFIGTDYGTRYGTDPVSMAWAYTGLFREDNTAKPALTLWETIRGQSLERSNRSRASVAHPVRFLFRRR